MVPECVPLARHAVQEAGYGDVVTVLEGYSTDIELPQKVDVVVHEILGNIASEEGVALSIADAAARLVREPGSTGWSIPHRAQTLVAPTAFPPVFENHVEVPAPRREYRLEQFPEELLLAEPQVCKPYPHPKKKHPSTTAGHTKESLLACWAKFSPVFPQEASMVSALWSMGPCAAACLGRCR